VARFADPVLVARFADPVLVARFSASQSLRALVHFCRPGFAADCLWITLLSVDNFSTACG